MKLITLLIIVIAVFLSSCSVARKQLRNHSGVVKTNNEIIYESAEERDKAPIREVEEKVVYVGGAAQNPGRYHVIIGSFRYIENAKKHQAIISNDGFSSEILRNENGLYRVTVLSTADINEARQEIHRIRSYFMRYNDTWLLIVK